MKESQVAVTDLNANILGREESTCGAGSSPDVVLVADTLTSWEGVHIRDHFGETLRPTDQKGVVGA